MSHKRERSPGDNPTVYTPQPSQKKQRRQSTQPVPQYQFNDNGSLTTRPIVRSASRSSEGPNYYTRERLMRRKDTPQPASTPPGICGIIPLSPNIEPGEDLPLSATVVHPSLSVESVASFSTSLEVDERRSLSMFHRNPENIQDVPPFTFLDQPISSYNFLLPAPQLNDHHSSRRRAAINPPNSSIDTQTHSVPSPRHGDNYFSSQRQQDFYLTGPSLDLTQRYSPYQAPEFDYCLYSQPSTESEQNFVDEGKDIHG